MATGTRESIKVLVGQIWRDKRSGKDFELAGIHNTHGNVQLVRGQDYKVMSQRSLKKNYELVPKEYASLLPADAPTDVEPEPVKPALPVKEKRERKPAIVKQTETKTGVGRGKGGHTKPGMILLPDDGGYMEPIPFVREYCGLDREHSNRSLNSVFYWLGNTRKGQELLGSKNATIVDYDSYTANIKQLESLQESTESELDESPAEVATDDMVEINVVEIAEVTNLDELPF